MNVYRLTLSVICLISVSACTEDSSNPSLDGDVDSDYEIDIVESYPDQDFVEDGDSEIDERIDEETTQEISPRLGWLCTSDDICLFSTNFCWEVEKETKIWNCGDLPISLNRIEIKQDRQGEFSLEGAIDSEDQPVTLAAREDYNLTVGYTPKNSGTDIAELHVSWNEEITIIPMHSYEDKCGTEVLQVLCEDTERDLQSDYMSDKECIIPQVRVGEMYNYEIMIRNAASVMYFDCSCMPQRMLEIHEVSLNQEAGSVFSLAPFEEHWWTYGCDGTGERMHIMCPGDYTAIPVNFSPVEPGEFEAVISVVNRSTNSLELYYSMEILLKGIAVEYSDGDFDLQECDIEESEMEGER